MPDLVRAIDLQVGIPNPLNVRNQFVIAFGPCTTKLWVALLRGMSPVARRGNLQNLANWLDPECVAMLVDEALQDLSRRSSSAWAKNALATFKISLALRSSLFSRSSSLIRSRSMLVRPSRMPVSTSCLRVHSCRVWGAQPIFNAIDSMAAQVEGYSPRCSCNMRTARSRTSGEKRFDLLIAPSSQRLEPPQNTGRFKVRLKSNRRYMVPLNT